MNRHIRAVIAIALWGVSVTGLAATRYVTDELRINLRTGAGNQFRIIEVLTTGTQLETLADRGNWTQVRTPDGQSGWVRSQYLTEQPAAADRLAELREQRSGAAERAGELQTTLEQARSELQAARQRIDELGASNERLTLQIGNAKRGLQLANENKRLKKQVIDLKRRVQDLQNETSRLNERSRQDWFLVGAAVMFVGIVFGILVTRIRWRRRSSWSEL